MLTVLGNKQETISICEESFLNAGAIFDNFGPAGRVDADRSPMRNRRCRGCCYALTGNPNPPRQVHLLAVHEALLIEHADFEEQILSDEEETSHAEQGLGSVPATRRHIVAGKIESVAT